MIIMGIWQACGQGGLDFEHLALWWEGGICPSEVFG